MADILPFPAQAAAANSAESLSAQLGADVDLATVLTAWEAATDRLQQTHAALCAEIGRLTHELEAKNRELTRKNRLADLGQMASHVAHEVRNSLVPVSLYLSLLRRRLANDADSRELCERLSTSLLAVETTVGDLLHFTAQREPRPQSIGVAKLLADLGNSLAPQLDAQRIHVSLDVNEGLCVDADADMLRRALMNLLLNAVDAMPDGGELCLTACRTAQGVEIEVADSGPGLTRDVQAKLFEPFFTTKSDGTGLGLAIVQRIAEGHGGQVTACDCRDGGAAFTLIFPHRARQQRMAA